MKNVFLMMLCLLGIGSSTWAAGNGVKVYDCKISFGESYKKTFLVDHQDAIIGVFSAEIALRTDGSIISGVVDGKSFQDRFPEVKFDSISEGKGTVTCT